MSTRIASWKSKIICQTYRHVGRHVDSDLLPIVDTDVSIRYRNGPMNAIRTEAAAEGCGRRRGPAAADGRGWHRRRPKARIL